MIKIKPKRKPVGFRERLAFALVRLANRVKPDNDAVVAFWMQQIQETFQEMLIHGTTNTTIKKIDSKDFFRKPEDLH